MDPKNLNIADYTYLLPEEHIAKFPVPQRDQSRLLYHAEGKIADHVFSALPKLLPSKSLLVFNDTKVVQARLLFQKPTGGGVEIFCLEPVLPHPEIVAAMTQTGSCTWKCLVGNAKRWKAGVLEMPMEITAGTGTLYAEKEATVGDHYLIRFWWEPANLAFAQVLEMAGKVPLPPYFKRASTPEDRARYQTVYAAREGAIAAPTAGLHFTEEVLQELKAEGMGTAYLTLHVGAGTFRPVKAERMADHGMHGEEMYVHRSLIEKVLQHLPYPVVPVGTTSMRTLESLYWIGAKLNKAPMQAPEPQTLDQWAPYQDREEVSTVAAFTAILKYLDRIEQDHLHATTHLLIAPGYTFRVCQGLITNFHQPESTLLLLVAAFVGPGWRSIYAHALSHGYRFLSYGDSSLLLPETPARF